MTQHDNPLGSGGGREFELRQGKGHYGTRSLGGGEKSQLGKSMGGEKYDRHWGILKEVKKVHMGDRTYSMGKKTSERKE